MLVKMLLLALFTTSCGQSVQGTKTPVFPGTANRSQGEVAKGSVTENTTESPNVIVPVQPVVVPKSYADIEPVMKQFCVTGCHQPGAVTLGGKKIFFDTRASIDETFKIFPPAAVASAITGLRMPPKSVKRSDDMTAQQRDDLVAWLTFGSDIGTKPAD